MSFRFRNLDEETRRLMVEEIEAAIQDGNLYYSTRFNPMGNQAWPELLLEAARSNDEHWLAYQLEARGLMKEFERRHTPFRGYTINHVPHTAAETMAEGQFNRFYILALARRGINEGKPTVSVYRAKQVDAPRPESESLVGRNLDSAQLITEIRPVQSSLGHELLKPNSGLSVQL